MKKLVLFTLLGSIFVSSADGMEKNAQLSKEENNKLESIKQIILDFNAATRNNIQCSYSKLDSLDSDKKLKSVDNQQLGEFWMLFGKLMLKHYSNRNKNLLNPDMKKLNQELFDILKLRLKELKTPKTKAKQQHEEEKNNLFNHDIKCNEQDQEFFDILKWRSKEFNQRMPDWQSAKDKQHLKSVIICFGITSEQMRIIKALEDLSAKNKEYCKRVDDEKRKYVDKQHIEKLKQLVKALGDLFTKNKEYCKRVKDVKRKYTDKQHREKWKQLVKALDDLFTKDKEYCKRIENEKQKYINKLIVAQKTAIEQKFASINKQVKNSNKQDTLATYESIDKLEDISQKLKQFILSGFNSNNKLAKSDMFTNFIKDKEFQLQKKQLSKSQIINSCDDIEPNMKFFIN